MASQLAIELTLENTASCLVLAGTPVVKPTYAVQNINLIPEIMEFDSSYDAMFLKGLRDGGVPIKFASWHTFLFNTQNSSSVNLLVQERNRSIKALFCVQRRSTGLLTEDHGACFFDSATGSSGTFSTLQNFQFRIGGRYYPASPVQCSTDTGSTISNGGAEAYVELAKALNIVGDYRLSSSINALRWAVPCASDPVFLPEQDYDLNFLTYDSGGRPIAKATVDLVKATAASAAGNMASACFAMSTSLETSNGIEISGLNAEEQSDIAVIARWSGPQAANFALEVYTYYDAMLILRENNVLELIQ